MPHFLNSTYGNRVLRSVLRFSLKRFTAEALECLQVATEALIIHLFEDSVLVMVNANRKTLMEKDVQLIRRIRGI